MKRSKLEEAKLKTAILNCNRFILEALEQDDKDMLRSYFEQLSDLMVSYLEEIE